MKNALSRLALVAAACALSATPAFAGDPTGPNEHEDEVRAKRIDVYHVTFTGGDEAEVGVRGDHDTDLDLFIYDEHDNLICSDEDDTDVMYCSWTPRRTGKFTIKIKNLGDVYNHYTLYTN